MNLPDHYRGSELVAQAPIALPGTLIDHQSDRLDLGRLFGVFRRRALMIATITAIGLLLALLITLRMPQQFTARADIALITDTKEVTPDSAREPDLETRGNERIETEEQTLGSRELAGMVYDRLNLGQDAAFTRLLQGGPGLVQRLTGSADERRTLTADELRERAIGRMRGSLDTQRIGNSYVIALTYTDTDPDRAARIANGYLDAHRDLQIRQQARRNREAIAILQTRMQELRAEAQSDFAAVQQYRIRNDLLSSAATSLTEQEISAYNQQVAIARAEAAQDAARLATARSQARSGAGNVGEATTSAVVSALRGQRAQLSAKLTELSARYLDTHPEVVAAREQIADIDAQIAAEVQRTLQALDARARASSERLASLSGSLGGARGTLAENNDALVQLDGLERSAQASQALYESYLNRYKEAVARTGAEQPRTNVISQAEPPLRPSAPNLPLNLLLGLLIGGILGTASAVAAEAAYSGLTTGEDAERRLGVRFLGGVPKNSSVKPHAASLAQTVVEHPGGASAESMRNIIASIRQAPRGRKQVVAVTSALPGEGKSTTALALARAAGMGQDRVVLVDCDTVRGQISATLGLPGDRPGLLSLVRDGGVLADAIVPDPETGISILPITAPFAKGQRLLDKGNLHRIVAQLREEYELIILDCPPVLPIAETRELVTLADSTVLVAQWRKTPDTAVKAAIKLLPMSLLDDVGVVLTQVDMRKRGRFGAGDAALFYGRYKNYYTS